MAKSVKTGTQEQALRAINSNLRTLSGVNGLLNSKVEESYAISITVGKQRAFVAVEKSFGDGILQDIRRKLVKETKVLAKKNAIILDGNDMETLDNRYPNKERLGLGVQNQEISGNSLAGNQETHDGSR